jgi:hypothetical protein
MTSEPDPVALNDVTDLTRLLKANALDALLRADAGHPCGCHGTFTCSGNTHLDEQALPAAEQVLLRRARILALQRQVNATEHSARPTRRPLPRD